MDTTEESSLLEIHSIKSVNEENSEEQKEQKKSLRERWREHKDKIATGVRV